MNWFKVDTELHRNDRVLEAFERSRAAGVDEPLGAVVVWLELLATNRRGGCDGRLPFRKSSPGYLATLLAGLGISREQVETILVGLGEAGLVQRLEGGDLLLPGWDDTWRAPKTGAERSAAARARRHKGNGTDVAPDTPPPSHPTRDDRRAGTTSDTSRERDREGEREGTNPPDARSSPVYGEPARGTSSGRASWGSVADHEGTLDPDGEACLRLLRLRSILTRRAHEQIDLAHRFAYAIGSACLADLLIRLEALKAGDWKETLAAKAGDSTYLEEVLEGYRATFEGDFPLDHDFGHVHRATVDQARELGGGEAVFFFELEIAGRYWRAITQGERRVSPEGDPLETWTLADVPSKYRALVSSDKGDELRKDCPTGREILSSR